LVGAAAGDGGGQDGKGELEEAVPPDVIEWARKALDDNPSLASKCLPPAVLQQMRAAENAAAGQAPAAPSASAHASEKDASSAKQTPRAVKKKKLSLRERKAVQRENIEKCRKVVAERKRK
jgi:hypothetical protein